MKKFFKVILYILIVLIVLATIAFLFRVKIVAYFVPAVDQTGDIHIEVRNDTAFISSRLTVRNKSFCKIVIDTLKYRISLEDKTYLKNNKFVGLKLAPYETDTIDFDVKIPYKTILADLAALRERGDSASYSINLFLQYSTVFGQAEIPIKKKAKLKIPQPPELSIVDIKYKKVHFKYILADATVKVMNYNNVSLIIRSMTYDMEVSKQGNLKGSYNKEIEIKPKGETYVNLPIEINVDNMGKTFLDIVRNKDNYYYTLSIKSVIESTDSTKRSFNIDITKDGRMELRK
jgi:LEA14-like dessication related protein